MAVSSTTGGLITGVCLSTDRPQNPYNGQVIYETDTNRTLVWDNSAWVVVADPALLSVDSTNSRIGIGTTSPDKDLHVVVGSKSGGSYGSTHNLVVDSDGDSGIGIYSGTANNGFLRFSDSLNVASGGFNYDHATDDLFIRTAGTDCVTIDSSGDVAFSNGIYLGGSTSSNYLNDYETGSWTPSFKTGSNLGTITGIASQECYYVKIGDWVNFYGALTLAGTFINITEGAAYFTIATTSLPFTPELCLTDSVSFQIGSVHLYDGYGSGANAHGFIGGNGVDVYFYVGMSVIGSTTSGGTYLFNGGYRINN